MIILFTIGIISLYWVLNDDSDHKDTRKTKYLQNTKNHVDNQPKNDSLAGKGKKTKLIDKQRDMRNEPESNSEEENDSDERLDDSYQNSNNQNSESELEESSEKINLNKCDKLIEQLSSTEKPEIKETSIKIFEPLN